MIISASYRTDIPAFYGEWFMNRLRAGYCLVVNPYSGKPYRVSLIKGEADGFFFCSKNMSPFMRSLEEVDSRGFPFVVHYTINGYPRELESAVVDARVSCMHLREIAGRYGPRAAVWRYDTILFTTMTDRAFHLENFERLARSLRGSTDEVVVSFATLYLKTRRNLESAARRHGFTWWDPSAGEKQSLLFELCAIAKSCDMTLSICAQKELLTSGAREAVCIDEVRLSDVAGVPIRASRKSHREGCSCNESRDIGCYDTCPHGCVYCYGTRDVELARRRYLLHDPSSEFLLARVTPDATGRTCRDNAGRAAE